MTLPLLVPRQPQTEGVFRPDNGWRHTIEVTSFVYASPGVEPIDPRPLGVIDRAGWPAPRALLHRAGDSARLMLTPDPDDWWHVFAVLEFTSDGLQSDGPLADALRRVCEDSS